MSDMHWLIVGIFIGIGASVFVTLGLLYALTSETVELDPLEYEMIER